MTQPNSFKNSSRSGKNLFGLTLILTLVIYLGMLVTPTKSHAKTSESSKKESLEKNNKNELLENNNKRTTVNKNSTDPIVSGKVLLKELRQLVRRDLLASGTNTVSAVDQTLDSLPINEVDNPAAFFNEEKLKAGAIGSLLISQNSPARAYSGYIKPILEIELKFKVERIIQNYGGENLYRVKNDLGIEFYMSLIGIGVPLPTQTFIVFWEKDPRNI